MIKQEYDIDLKVKIEVLEERINCLKELIEQHNKGLQVSIDKAEVAMKTKTDSMNEFRAQQADIIKTFAREDKLEAYVKSSSERYEANVKVVNDKIYQLEKQMDVQIRQGIQIITDKFEAMHKVSNVKLENVEVVMEKRFTDIMKDYIRPLFDWKNNVQGSIMNIGSLVDWKNNMQGRGVVLLWIWPVILSIITAIIMAVFIK